MENKSAGHFQVLYLLMCKMYFLYKLLYLVDLPLIYCDFTLHIIYSEVRPFVFRNDKGEIDGIIPKQFELGVKACKTLENDSFHLNYVGEEPISKLNEKLIDKKMSIKDIFTAVSAPSYNTSQLDLDSHAPFLFPYLGGYEGKELIDPQLIVTRHIAVIMLKTHISLSKKVINSIYYSVSLLVQIFLLVIVIAIIMTLLENSHIIFSGIPSSSLLQNVWFTIVTCTTVGYGDHFPVSKLGKLVGLFWMMTSLILVCIFTAAVSGNVLGEDVNALLRGNKIAVSKNTYEADIAVKNYPRSRIIRKESYKKVIHAVINSDAIAGLLNADHAAWIQDELREKHVHVVQLLQYDVSVNGLVEFHKDMEKLYKCMRNNFKDIMELPILYFRKDCEPEYLLYGDTLSLVKDNWYFPLFIATVVLIVCTGAIHQLMTCRKIDMKSAGSDLHDSVRENDFSYGGRIDFREHVSAICSDVKEIKDELTHRRYKIREFLYSNIH